MEEQGFIDSREEMEKILSDPTKAYEAQVRELYTMGIYLATRKFRFVRFAYLSFMAGFVASGIVLLLTEIMG